MTDIVTLLIRIWIVASFSVFLMLSWACVTEFSIGLAGISCFALAIGLTSTVVVKSYYRSAHKREFIIVPALHY